ncbi:hypothetical protein [Oligoflexus tunisiensis]|uniref:hypothetical protein n=1 Tax=Oligoflexus tunisiensis TaxID=708132 RepID=UPI00114CEA53|nr:hypothetical protein [Oligoflexus tunisiensis]
MRISRLLYPTTWLVGQLFCLQAASAQTVVTEKVESKPIGLHPSVSTSYLRSAADEDSAYYQSIAAMEFNLGYTLPDSGSLLLSTGVSRDLDALEERNIWSTTALTYASKAFDVADDLTFRYSATVVAPTNADMRDYLSYRGSLSAGAGLTRTWNGLPVGKSLALGLSGTGARNFFEYDATEAGWPNTMVTLGSSVSALLEITDMIQLSGNYGFKKVQKSNGTWQDMRYEHEIAAGIDLNEQLSVSVSESTENRAYSYDAQTVQFALYDFQTTIYELAATYTF